MTSPIQGIKGSASNAVNGFKNMSTKKKVAAAVATVAVVGSLIAAYKRGGIGADEFLKEGEKLKLSKRLQLGYSSLAKTVADYAIMAKEKVSSIFNKADK